MPDAGKSTFIKNLVRVITGKELSPDTLMKEVHWSDGRDPSGNPDTRTIKCAKIFMQYRGLEFCFYDCPGHLEYDDQIKQGLSAAHYVVGIVDKSRENDSWEYIDNIPYIDKVLLSHC